MGLGRNSEACLSGSIVDAQQLESEVVIVERGQEMNGLSDDPGSVPTISSKKQWLSAAGWL